MSNQAEQYYNNYIVKQVCDYVRGNPRTEAAIRFAKEMRATFGCLKTLDIGCGIGWSTHEFATAAPDCKVDGIDLSPALVGTANKLFARHNASFNRVDVTEEGAFSLSGPYDSIVLLDVYEHIPASHRRQFHDRIAASLASDGIIILTCPTVHHQRYLRDEKPEGIQPVDEDVDLAALETFARHVDGEIVHFSQKRIWNPFDYFHAVIARGVSRTRVMRVDGGAQVNESKAERYQRVRNCLGEEFLDEAGLAVSTRPAQAAAMFQKLKRYLSA